MSTNLQLKTIQQKIASLEQQYQRISHSVKLLAVSKGQPLEKILQAIQAGQRAFGENYLQESMAKIERLKPLYAENIALEWHFIGHVQGNKAKLIAQTFDWVHTVDRSQIAILLNQHRPPHLAPLNVCIQVNICNETSKSGLSLPELPALAREITQLPQLKLRGLMTIPKVSKTLEDQRKPFHTLQTALKSLNDNGFALDTLSMGMTDDYEAAIAEGATIIRLGTAIFGERRTS